MYTFLLLLQIADIFVTLFCIFLLLRLRGSVDNKYLFLSAILVEAYSIGYLMEMLSFTEETIRVALSFEYFGLSYITLALTLFVSNTCGRKKINRPMIYGMLAFQSFIYALVLLGDRTTLYYSSFKVSNTGYFPHMETGKAPLYFVFAAYDMLLLLNCGIMIFLSWKKESRRSGKRRYTFLLAEVLISLFAMVATIIINTGGWDPSPTILSFIVVSMTITVKGGKFFDVTSLARDDLFETVGEGIIITDANKRFVECNKAAENLFPVLIETDQGLPVDGLGIDPFNVSESTYFNKDGRYYRSECAALYEKNAHVGYVVNITDVTDIRNQMDEMRELKEKADAANIAKSAFLANMSHEIRTPLNAIIGMSELCEKEKTEKVLREYVAQINSSGKTLLGIVNDVLDFSKAEAGKLELSMVEFETAPFLNSIINVTNMRIGDKPVKLIVDIDPSIPKKLYADDVHIRQILLNLLSNADKFTLNGHIKLKLDAEQDGKRLKLIGSVEDTGMGIKAEDKERIFDAFRQLDMKRNRKIQGSGLGLAIFAQLVTLMEGEYSLESHYGSGSKFSFYIMVDSASVEPMSVDERAERIVEKDSAIFYLYDSGNAAAVKQASVVNAMIPDYSSRKILVVDDNKVNVKVLSAFLRQFGVEAASAYSGEECIDLVKENRYDLIFMDHMMPGMDGIETTKIIREMDGDYYRKVPIIACTANVIKGVEELFLDSGMNDFVPKPIQLQVLQEKMSRFL